MGRCSGRFLTAVFLGLVSAGALGHNLSADNSAYVQGLSGPAIGPFLGLHDLSECFSISILVDEVIQLGVERETSVIDFCLEAISQRIAEICDGVSRACSVTFLVESFKVFRLLENHLGDLGGRSSSSSQRGKGFIGFRMR